MEAMKLNHVFPFPTNGKVHVNGKPVKPFLFVLKFPFPTNGKVHVNDNGMFHRSITVWVSIPYERESSCEPIQACGMLNYLQFPFPTNGKVHVNTLSLLLLLVLPTFPFPTNGKVHVNRL